MAKAESHAWEFKARFRKGAFGWKSQPAIARVKEAVTEIKKAAKKEPVIAAEGAVAFLERVSPAIAQVDSSSGSMGSAVNKAIADLVPIIASAPAGDAARKEWLERLFAAHAADRIPYIERLADRWGELCGSKQLASAWADRLLPETRAALDPGATTRAFFHGTAACLSALFTAERYDELILLLNVERTIWDYKRWAAKALVAQSKNAEALRYAESCKAPRGGDPRIDAFCEELLLSSGLVDEAYARYGLRSLELGGTYVGIFRDVVKRYPHKPPADILADLVAATPGAEGKWFAAAKDAGLYDEALPLARRTPCDPRTLARAARDFAEEQPAFAIDAGLLALHWLVEGYGYEVTSGDVLDAYRSAVAAAETAGTVGAVKERVRELVATKTSGAEFIVKVLGRRELVAR